MSLFESNLISFTLRLRESFKGFTKLVTSIINLRENKNECESNSRVSTVVLKLCNSTIKSAEPRYSLVLSDSKTTLPYSTFSKSISIGNLLKPRLLSCSDLR